MEKYKIGDTVIVESPNHYGQDVFVNGVIVEDNGEQYVKVEGRETAVSIDDNGDIVESTNIGWDGGHFSMDFILD
jgi:hypothetical protein